MNADKETHEESPERTSRVAQPLAGTLAVLAAVMRFVPNRFNVTPVGALCLYSGARLSTWQAFALSLGTLFTTNVVLAALYGKVFLATPVLLFVYASFAINVFLGRMVRHSGSAWRLAAVTILASVQFYLLTNFGHWLCFGVNDPSAVNLTLGIYPHTLSGLLTCYVEGLPMFRNTLIGDLLFTGASFGVHAALVRSGVLGRRVRTSVPVH